MCEQEQKMLPYIIAAMTAARIAQQRKQQQPTTPRYLPPTNNANKISKFEWALIAFIVLCVVAIVIMCILGR